MNNRRGVTLIELLVVVSVLGIVLIPILGIFGFATRQFGSQTGRAKTIFIANQAMNAMTKEISKAVTTQNDSSGIPSIFVMPGSTDASGNYTPVMQSGTLTYTSGVPVQFYLGDAKGKNDIGTQPTNIWRQTAQSGGLLGGLLGGLKWTPDNAWSLLPGGKKSTVPQFPNTTALTFTTTGMPANTVRVSLTMTDAEGSQTSSYTVSRSVYLSNHN